MIPKDPVKRFSTVFEKYRHKYEPYALFERFLEFVIVGFDQTFSKIGRPFDENEGTACMELFGEWTQIMNDQLKHREWYDLLGEVYMNYLSGTMKKHWTGQYFTPMHMCDMMAQIADPGEVVGERIMDCACGSGRMLLAAHILHLGNYCYAQDLDRVCCLMTVCNFIIHGVKGEVVWGDCLNQVDYRGGWKTNELLGIIGVPCVRTMDKMESMSYRNGLLMLAKMDAEDTNKSKSTKEKTPTSGVKENQETKKPKMAPIQLSLFE